MMMKTSKVNYNDVNNKTFDAELKI